MRSAAPSLTLGTLGFPALGSESARSLVNLALEQGICAFDTADVYGNGTAEELLGAALKGRRDEVLISTKVGINHDGSTLTAQSVTERLEASLSRLGTDRVEICYIHMPDPRANFDEILAALDQLIRAGKVRAAGLSNFPAEMVAMHAAAARTAELEAPSWLQVQYSILDRSAESSTFPLASTLGLDVQIWGPLSSGWLTETALRSGSASVDEGRASRRPRSFDSTLPGNVRKVAIVRKVGALAAGYGLPISRLALAFAMAHRAVGSVIIGPAYADQLLECSAAVGSILDGELLDAVDELVAPGTIVNPDDTAWRYPEVLDSRLRRRS